MRFDALKYVFEACVSIFYSAIKVLQLFTVYSEPCFLAPQMRLLSHTLIINLEGPVKCSLTARVLPSAFKIDTLIPKLNDHSLLMEGGVHIRGEICQRSDPDITHMRYYPGPLKLKYWVWDLR